MLTATKNKSITILVTERELSTVKSIIKFLSDKFPGFAVLNFRKGKLGEDYLINFKVYPKYYSKVLEKLAYNDIELIMKDKDTLLYVDEKKEQRRKRRLAEGWAAITKTKRHLTIKELHTLADEGKLKEMIKEAKGGINSKLVIVTKAKELLNTTVENAISNLIDLSESAPSKIEESINHLINIASLKDLKLFNMYDQMNLAGYAAIDLAVSNEKQFHKIIDILNNSNLNTMVNIRAALALSNLVFSEAAKSSKYFPDYIKTTNTRWLKIVFETIQKKLTKEEEENIQNLIAHIEEEKKQL
ncbi:MAG: hypothetical protein CR986_01845 [Ignavibacteriae bacterium]|nr:MAG: hypothetical protein CR986_01845 [Ignavibacteriota bacterium]